MPPPPLFEKPIDREDDDADGQDCGLRTILVVDDEFPIRELISFFLQRRGYRTVQAAEGEAALEILRTCTVDLVLTDLSMPGMDGMGLIRAIKPIYPEMKIIVLSGILSFNPELREDLELLGVDAILAKPLITEDLLSALQTALACKPSK